MFSLKPILATTIVISSVLSQQLAIAYPKTSSGSELDYLEYIFENGMGISSPEFNSYLVEKYDNGDSDLFNMLASGYELCDMIQEANQKGINSETVIERELATYNSEIAKRREVSREAELYVVYESTKEYLCPELN